MSIALDTPAFEICSPSGGSIKIWANGRTEGFEEHFENGWFIRNRIPLLIAQAQLRGQEAIHLADQSAAPGPAQPAEETA
jgi:hypothetical protein